jgi:excisionase family DNA binding protein
MKSTYSTAELADMFDVNESTVKRWADQGHIECVKTKGGHRRFPIRSVLKYVHENKLSIPNLDSELIADKHLRAKVIAGNVHVLIADLRDAMMKGETEEVLRILRLGLAARPDLLHLYNDLVFPPLVEIGERWAKGELTVDIEHLATHATKDALQRLQGELFQKQFNGHTALLACYERDQHDLGLRCVNQYLTAEGWRTLFLGSQTPTDSLVFSINRNKPDLVIVSAIVIEDEKRFIRDVNHEILPAVRSVGGKLAVGGASITQRYGQRLEADFLSDSILDYAQIAEMSHHDHA